MRHAEAVELLVEAGRIGARDVEPEDARVDPALAERRQQCQQMSLRAAHAGELVEVEGSHRSRA
jgi:hypothetical protein